LLEDTHKGDPESNTILVQRKNLDGYSECEEDPKNGNQGGVDLNRNYGVDWKLNAAQKDPCSEFYAGKGAFSEKETQAMKQFLEEKAGEIQFVVNFHSNGNSFMWPFNGRNPNDIEKRAPGVLSIV
jgi:hypothetical protein